MDRRQFIAESTPALSTLASVEGAESAFSPEQGEGGADIIALPETLRGQNDKSQEGLDGPTVSAMPRLLANIGPISFAPSTGKMATVCQRGVHEAPQCPARPGRDGLVDGLRPGRPRHLLRRESGAAVAAPVGPGGGAGNLAQRLLGR